MKMERVGEDLMNLMDRLENMLWSGASKSDMEWEIENLKDLLHELTPKNRKEFKNWCAERYPLTTKKLKWSQ